MARRFGLTTSLGATLDAVADKLAQVSTVTFLALFGSTIFTPLPLWLLGVLVARDGVLGVGWWVVHRKRGTVNAEHRWHGKASSTLLFALIFAALAGVASRWVWLGSALVILLVIPSTVAYLREGWRQLQGQAPVGAPVSRTA